MTRYAGKVVVVAGFANALTIALASAFADEGASVAAPNADFEAQIDETARKHGRIDVLITNFLLPVPRDALTDAERLSPDDWRTVQERCFTLPALTAQAAGRLMLDQGRGSIVHIGPVHGLFAQARGAAYCAAAGGLFMHTKALAVAWGARGVRVNAIACGVLPEDRTAPDQTLLSRVPIGRRADHREVCEAALFLGGEEASFVTGEVLRVDGGWTAYHLFFPFETAF
jgi:NAD(P)-dependent dehydrogenase (short-subunit alcohol dehydrogenase family)